MSKGSDGPAATSFEHPRKVGWLQKHGGSGMSSHWKKRWFIVDHHYMFYYKGPSDKKPVGILCLPEYQSCHKSESKDSKRTHTFMLDKGGEDSGDIKSYILCSDSEEETAAWIAAITEEIKPMIGGNNFGYRGGGGGGKEPKIKVDQKALDEVTAIASEGPKLTHLTASRPKMKGRRPPKRYQVFHEEEENQESPPDTPSTVTPAAPTTPEPSPSASPATAKKGFRPSAPMLPTKPLTPPTKPKTVAEQSPEAPEAQHRPTFSKPLPPRKVPAASRPATTPTEPSTTTADSNTSRGEPVVAPRPIPHKKPRMPPGGNSPPQPGREPPAIVAAEPIAAPANENKPRPVPPSKPRPRAKPRVPSGGGETLGAPPPSAPTTTPTEPVSTTLETPPTPTKRPTPIPRPVPTPRRVSSASEVKRQEEDERKGEEEGQEPVAPEEPRQEPAEEIKPPIEKQESLKEEERESNALPPETTAEDAQANPSPSPEEISHKTTDAETKQEAPPEEVEALQLPPKQDKEASPAREGSEDSRLYEEMGSEAKTAPADNEMYEIMDYTPTRSGNKNTEDTTSTGREEADAKSLKSHQSVDSLGNPLPAKSESEYEEMEAPKGSLDSLERKSGEDDYERPEGWNDTPSHDRRSSMGFDPMTPPLATDTSEAAGSGAKENGLYATIHGPPRPAYANGDERPESTSSASTNLGDGAPVGGAGGGGSTETPDRRPPQSPDVGGRRTHSHSISSNGSISSGHSENFSQQQRKGSKGSKGRAGSHSNSSRSNSIDAESNHIGIANRKGSFEKKGTPRKNSYGSDGGLAVPGKLQQAREILRLARAMRAEAEQMKEEAYRELELARRERHDASLLKKNAAEILKIAKCKLAIK